MKTIQSALALFMLFNVSGIHSSELNDTGIRPNQYSWDQDTTLFSNDFGSGINTIIFNT